MAAIWGTSLQGTGAELERGRGEVKAGWAYWFRAGSHAKVSETGAWEGAR